MRASEKVGSDIRMTTSSGDMRTDSGVSLVSLHLHGGYLTAHIGVSHPEGLLPGSLRLKRRAPGLYKRLMRGFYPGLLDTSQSPSGQGKTSSAPGSSPSDPGRAVTSAVTPGSATGVTFKKLRGKQEHPLPPIPPRNAVFPAMDFLSAYAIAVNEVNAAGGRIVTVSSKRGKSSEALPVLTLPLLCSASL